MKTLTRSFVLALATVAVLAGPAVGNAYAVTLRDLIELSKEGVTDAVLIALIETDGSRFKMTPDDVRSARAQGLSDAVIVAMIRTRVSAAPLRDGVVAELPPAPAPAQETRTIVIREPAPPPTVVYQTVTQTVEVERPREPQYVPVYVPVAVRPVREVEKKKEEPVYWGWGGQRRPDAWKEPVIIK